MTLSRESVLTLQRHFLGALSAPPRTWLKPLRATRLTVTGDVVRTDKDGSCLLDLGTAEAAVDAHCVVRIGARAGGSVHLSVCVAPPWLEVTSRGPELAIQAQHVSEGDHRGVVTLTIRDGEIDRSESLQVQLRVRRSKPVAEIDFHGSPAPHEFDFGNDSRTYQLSVRNQSPVPLLVSFSDLPSWLRFEVDGRHRSGPISGPFFERRAPFVVGIRPQLLGRHEGILRMHTNDGRPEFQNISLQFRGALSAVRPHVRALAPRPLAMRNGQSLITVVRLENWGRLPARIACVTPPRGIAVAKVPPIAAAHDGLPGNAVLPIGVTSEHLESGTHRLILALQIENGSPPEIQIPVEIIVAATSLEPTSSGRPGILAAFLTIVVLTILLLIVVEAWS